MRMKYVCSMVCLLMTLGLAGCNTAKEDSTVTNAVQPITETEGEEKKPAEVKISEATKEELLQGKDLNFSQTEYFYDHDIEVELLSAKEGQIFYTMDGKDPTRDASLYNDPIKLVAGVNVSATCVKAKAFFNDGTESDTIVHTYFVSQNVMKRFDTLIFSVTTDPYNLYDNEYGIFVEGKLRKDYIKEHPGEQINPDAPANYNMRGKDSEREVFLEVISPEGSQIISQAAGIRTYGGWSRAREQKSIKLFARKEYDPDNNKFKFDFFPEKNSADGTGNVLDSFKQLVLRNCGNDNGFGFIRDELFQTLAREAGYQDNEAVRPAALYVNGDYRGFFWLHEVYCDEYFEDHYGKYNGNFEILEGGELYKKIATDGDNEDVVEEYGSMYDKYASSDLTKEANYQEVSDLIDIQNYLEYYALQTLIANEDWPHNNYRAYRYYAAKGEEYREAPFDGKWRYLLHDLDYSYGIYGASANTNTIANYVGVNGEIKDVSPLFSQLMRREDCREIFIKKSLDLINGAFSVTNLNDVLDSMNELRINELNYTYNKDLLEDWVVPGDLARQINGIKNYNNIRAKHILTSYKDYFGLSGIYTLGVENIEGCKTKINSYITDHDFAGSYYMDYSTELSVILPEDKELDYWIVNGEMVEQEMLVITTEMVKDELVEVSYVIK